MYQSNRENFLSIKDTKSSEAGAMGRLVNEPKKKVRHVTVRECDKTQGNNKEIKQS